MNTSKLLKLVMAVLLAALLSPSFAHAQSEVKPRLVVLPFTLNAAEDLAYLKEGVRTMLASRIAAKAGVVVVGGNQAAKIAGGGVELDPKGIAAELDGDLILSGSITALGASVSIDARLLRVESGNSDSFFATAENQAGIIGSVDRLATEISRVITGKGRPVVTADLPEVEPAKDQEQSSPPAEDKSVHPDRMFKESVAVPAPVPVPSPVDVQVAPPLASPVVPQSSVSGQVTAGPVMSGGRSQFLDMEIQVIDVGDLFGGGEEDIVIAGKQRITIYRSKNNQLQKVADIPGPPDYVRIVGLNLADLNNNGRDEVYISAVTDNTPYSYALEWGSQGFAEIFERRYHYIRPILVPGNGWGLYGQEADLDGPVRSGIYKVDQKTGKLDKNDKLGIPDSINLYEFVLGDFTGNGETEIAVQTQDNELLLYNASGEALWQGSGNYGYTKRFIGKPYSGSGNNVTIQVPTRLVARDLNGDGRLDLAVMENPAGLATLIKTVGSFVGGSVKVMTWNGVTFADLWSTGEIGSYIASVQVADGRIYLGMVAKKSGGLFKGFHSSVASYDLVW